MTRPATEIQSLANGRYVVRRRLGEGGMGAVYLARDQRLGVDVVVKIPHAAMLQDQEFAARFQMEIRSLVELRHRNVVAITDVGEEGGLPFAVMPFLEGGTLEDRLGHGPLSVNALAEWLPDVCEALDFIHSQGYVHRDIKPANILFDRSGNVYVSDLGIARTMDESDRRLTGTGMVMGTVDYIAPETIAGQLDGRADQYAIGVMTYQALSGKLVFEAETPQQVMVMHATMPPPTLETVRPDLSRTVIVAVDRVLQKDPDQRFPNCREFSEAVLARCGQTEERGNLPSVPIADQSPDIRFACPKCRTRARVKRETAGQVGRCRKCGVRIRIPSGAGNHEKARATTSVPGDTESLRSSAKDTSATTTQPKTSHAPQCPVNLVIPKRSSARNRRKKRSPFLLSSMLLIALSGFACWKLSGVSPDLSRFFSELASPSESSAHQPVSESSREPGDDGGVIIRVVDSQGQPISNASVQTQEDAATEQLLRTDRNGRVRWLAQDAGPLRISAAGYTPREISVTDHRDMTVTLRRQATLQGRILVTSTSDREHLGALTIILRNPVTGDQRTGRIESDATFRLAGLEPGTYEYTVSGDHIYRTVQTVDLPSGVSTKDIFVEPKDAEVHEVISRLLTDSWGTDSRANATAAQIFQSTSTRVQSVPLVILATTLASVSQETDISHETLSELPEHLEEIAFGVQIADAVRKQDIVAFRRIVKSRTQPVHAKALATFLGRAVALMSSTGGDSAELSDELRELVAPLTDASVLPTFHEALRTAEADYRQALDNATQEQQAEYASELRPLVSARTELAKSLDTSREQMTTLDETLQEYIRKGTDEFVRIDADIAKSVVTRNQSAQQMQQIGNTMGQLQGQMNALQNQLRGLSQQLSDQPDQADLIRSQMATLNAQGAGLQNQYAAQQRLLLLPTRQNSGAVKEIARLTNRKAAINTEFLARRKQMAFEYAQLKAATALLRKGLRAKDEELEAVKSKYGLKTDGDVAFQRLPPEAPLEAWREELLTWIQRP